MVGVKTHVVTAVDPRQGCRDNKQLPALVEHTARTFPIGDVTADKTYATMQIADTIARHGGQPVH